MLTPATLIATGRELAAALAGGDAKRAMLALCDALEAAEAGSKATSDLLLKTHGLLRESESGYSGALTRLPAVESDRDALCARLAAVEAERDKADRLAIEQADRCRVATQAIVEAIGAAGPENLESAVARIVGRVAKLEAVVEAARTLATAAHAVAMFQPAVQAKTQALADMLGAFYDAAQDMSGHLAALDAADGTAQQPKESGE